MTELPLRDTGIIDRDGTPILEGDWVSLDGNMTADDSFGLLPNGFHFDETDVYQVYWPVEIRRDIRVERKGTIPEGGLPT